MFPVDFNSQILIVDTIILLLQRFAKGVITSLRLGPKDLLGNPLGTRVQLRGYTQQKSKPTITTTTTVDVNGNLLTWDLALTWKEISCQVANMSNSRIDSKYKQELPSSTQTSTSTTT